MEDITEELAQLEKAAKKLPQKDVLNVTQGEVDAEDELRRDIEKIESALNRRILPQMVDKQPFFIEQMPNLTVEWFLFKDSENHIKVLYKETPAETDKGSKYEAKTEEKSVFGWDLEITKLIIERLPAFIELITKESEKYK